VSKENLHTAISELKELRDQLGRLPTRREFVAVYGWKFENLAGSWLQFVQMAGMDAKDIKQKQQKSNDFYIDLISKSVDEVKETSKIFTPQFPLLGPYPRIIAIGDLHAPWICQDSLKKIYEIVEKVQPQFIVTMGDEYDFFSQSKFPKTIVITPNEEVTSAQKMLQEMFCELHKRAPKAKIYAIKGNHSIRPIKRLIEAAPELMPFFDFERFFDFPYCETIRDSREKLIISGITFHHGFMGHGQHMLKFETPTVVGHLHNGGVIMKKVNNKWLWELNAGYVGKPEEVCFNYTPVREQKWTRGVGYISEFGPHFIPFE